MPDQSMTEFAPKISPEARGETFSFGLRPGVGNKAVIQALNHFQPESTRSAAEMVSLFAPITLETDSSLVTEKAGKKAESLWDQLGPAYASPNRLSAENRDTLEAVTYSLLDSLANQGTEIKYRGQARNLSSQALEKAKAKLADYSDYLLEGGEQGLKSRRNWKRLRQVAMTTGLAALFAACDLLSAAAPVSSVRLNSEGVRSTAQQLTEEYQTATAQAPTATPTETPTQVETEEPRAQVLTKEELFEDNKHIGVWESRDQGGYFSKIEQLEEPEKYVYMDFSYEGEIRIVEFDGLDEQSWGLWTLKEHQLADGTLVPIERIGLGIRMQLEQYGRDLKVVWGNFEKGRSFFVADESLFHWSGNGFSEEKLKDALLPTKDEHFSCEETNAFTGDPGYETESHGTLCKFTG